MKAAIPQLKAALPGDDGSDIANDRTTTIRASLHDTERTLLISVALVTMVVFLFLRSARATHHPGHRRAGVAHRHLRHDVSARL